MSLLKFWGVQGSCPGNKHHDHMGDNTSCISYEEDNILYIFDAGTGIRHLSQQLNPTNYKKIILFITHSHWDHIQGFPFFGFLHAPCTIEIYSHNPAHIDAMIGQINGINFPLHSNDLTATLSPTKDLAKINQENNIQVETIRTNHHGDCIGYRFKSKSADFCYIPDNQLHNSSTTSFDEFCAFIENTNVLIHDAQYTENDMPHKENWGHSTVKDAVLLAEQSKATTFVIFHHDPERTKTEILEIETTLNNHTTVNVQAAFEGLELHLLGN